jgi:DNA-binding beta-propeller fold protein YncE
MPIVAAAPPVAITPPGGFDYVTIDAVNRRAYAAHGAVLLIVDADKGTIVGTVQLGGVAGSAPNTATGHVYTGNGDAKALSEVDPVSLKEVQRVSVDGPVDAIAYDPQLGRIYGDEDDGTRIFVIDSKTFKQIGTITVPGHKPEYIQINPTTHEIYQNIDSESEISVIDPQTMKVTRNIPTPEIMHNHPLQYDAPYDMLLVAGTNNKMSGYSSAGKLLWTIDYPSRVDQCDLDVSRQLMACAGNGITLLKINQNGPAQIVASLPMTPGPHTVAIDPKTGDIWAVWGTRASATAPATAFLQRFRYQP